MIPPDAPCPPAEADVLRLCEGEAALCNVRAALDEAARDIERTRAVIEANRALIASVQALLDELNLRFSHPCREWARNSADRSAGRG